MESKELIPESGYKGRWVKKTPKEIKAAISDPERAVRIWKEINDSKQYPVSLYNKHSWISPYLNSNTSLKDDKVIAAKILDVYRKTGRLILDGFVTDNSKFGFPASSEKLDGEDKENKSLVFVDVDLALRRGSWTTDQFYKVCEQYQLMKVMQDRWDALENRLPYTIKVIRNLFYIDKNIRNIDHKYLKFDLILSISAKIKNKINLCILNVLLLISDIDATFLKQEICQNFIISNFFETFLYIKEQFADLIIKQPAKIYLKMLNFKKYLFGLKIPAYVRKKIFEN